MQASIGWRLPNNQAALDKADLDERVLAALDWIQQAHKATGQAGISKGYDLLRGRWAPAYPETTGYSIPTLLNAAMRFDRSDFRALALSLADFLLGSTTSEGGVVHWAEHSAGIPIVFDTGQVIFGWLAAFDASQDERYLQAAIKSGNWLVSIQDGSGAWMRGQYLDVTKVIDTRVAWALVELSQRAGQQVFQEAARKNLDWALKQQNTAGWFKHCAFTNEADPFTHTLAYTAEGFFECGRLLNVSEYIEASRRTATALLEVQRLSGALASTYDQNWFETDRSSCLTGNCQMSRLWLSFYELTDDRRYFEAALKALEFVAATQSLQASPAEIRGAIAGSYPVYGVYERFKYPNWAAKFFIDALLMLDRINEGGKPLPFVG
ncbi:MAG TPA: hypothetical protein VLA49_07665 [Anaerolineales bacterium]|nr:hypothetical protein [Anaerolineales bacterium]